MERAGAEGELLAHLVDRNGRPCDHRSNACLVALTLDELARVPRRIAVAPGDEGGADLAVLRGRAAGELVTDDETARAVVESMERKPMQLEREIGTSGIEASAVGLGTWAMGGWMWGGGDDEASVAAIRASLDAGVTLVDTAPAYGLGRAEEVVGRAIAAGVTRLCW